LAALGSNFGAAIATDGIVAKGGNSSTFILAASDKNCLLAHQVRVTGASLFSIVNFDPTTWQECGMLW
jgi:hypothetical protein